MVPDSHAISPNSSAKAIVSPRRALFALPLFALWPVAFSRHAFSNERPDDFDPIRQASELMAEWFAELRRATSAIGGTPVRQRLKKALVNLDHQLITLKIRESDFIDVLKQPTPGKESVEGAVRNLRGSVEDVLAAVTQVIPLVREDHRKKGQKAASLVSSAIYDRKILSDDFNYDAVIADSSAYISKCREAKKAVKAAYEALEELI